MSRVSIVIFGLAAITVVALSSRLLFADQSQAGSPAPREQGQPIPGCNIPKDYGHLVTILPGNNNGLAGQAVFEAEDGTIRWVALMFNATQVIMQKPARRVQPNFPVLPLYECAVGHVWQRP